MALISWNNTYSIQIGEIDSQHQKLVHMINDLYDSMKTGKGKEAVGKIIDGLISYTQSHFAAEEKYFAKFAYPDADAHKAEHAAFVKKAADFRDGYQKGKIGLSLEVLNFLSDWLRTHIQGSDKKYSPLFIAKGVK